MDVPNGVAQKPAFLRDRGMSNTEPRPEDQMSRLIRRPGDRAPVDDSSAHLNDLIDEEDDDFASANASDSSFPRSSFQGAKGGASAPRVGPCIQRPAALAPQA